MLLIKILMSYDKDAKHWWVCFDFYVLKMILKCHAYNLL